ncbi:hypothetical protein BGW36DRAFT_431121 [Talaromyces proteolyticus]|uniref:FAD/NAD(P)-binding domain-containing protein n=1 Tax=Talaromyces proteolyticus TaxID=1131652 RepID=A0AAD4KGJ7_9EURO|nr:uncharacterized protein BGW36DRAFT_431121 [Talaromyces proteolyticus]KAH8691878.1 hypothetical protein BGW36DRAFT_431121 [Talaromyces proteolyticus]
MSPLWSSLPVESNVVRDNGITNGSTKNSQSNGSAEEPVPVDISTEIQYPQNGSGRNYALPNTWHSKKTKIRVVCIGAGPSGICLAYKMQHQMDPNTWELSIYEKNDDICGTWYENKYPGCACDIPSHIYTYSFEPNPQWSTYFAYAPEILQYFRKFAEKHQCRRFIQVNSKVVAATWHPSEGIYKIVIEDTTTGETREDWSHVLVNATGNLNKWKWPEIEGLHDFAGPKMHPSQWDESVDFAGKTVGIIGTGSTAIQVVPQLQKISKNLKLFMRSPTWISPPFGGDVLKDDIKGGQENTASRQYVFTEEDKRKFREDPNFLLNLRQKIEAEVNLLFPFFERGTNLQKKMHSKMTEEMNTRIGSGHDELKKHLIPKWLPGCRRITPGDGYLEALTQENVQPIFNDISKITRDGVIDFDGELHKVDILVCATGFDIPYAPHFKLTNGDGINMQDDWNNDPNLYLGVTAPRYPNYFVMVGVGGTWANGTILPALETASEHFIKIFRKMQEEGIKSIEVTQDACDDFIYHLELFHKSKQTVWSDSCRSWYKKNGKAWIWPGATIHYLKTLNAPPRYEDYKFTYWKGRRFAYFGDGNVQATVLKEDVSALAPYIRKSDHPWDIA